MATSVKWQKVPGENVWVAKVRGGLECRVLFKGYRDPLAKDPVLIMDWEIARKGKILAVGGNLPYSDSDSILAVKQTKDLCEEALQKYL